MKVIIQRVSRCTVSVSNEVISSIGNGMLVLVGISQDDTDEDMKYMTQKILNVRLFDNDSKRWSTSIVDKDYEVLCVSQFTLCHKLKGNKLDFHNAMPSKDSQAFYGKFLKQLKSSYKPDKIKDGQFGSYMSVELCNDGPVTIELNSKLGKQNEEKS